MRARDTDDTEDNLDFVRAFAVLLVVLEHTLLALRIMHIGRWPTEQIGVAGVYIFFVHTSLVLMWSLERKPYMLDFYIRRIFRIYPLAIVAITIAVVFQISVAGSPKHYFEYVPVTAKQFIFACLLIQDLSVGSPSIISVLWSLPLEMHMYILLPFAFFLVERERSLWPILLVWGLAAEVARTLAPGTDVTFLTVIPDFLPGVMAYIMYGRRRPVVPAWTLLPLLTFLFVFYIIAPGPRRGWFFCLFLGLSLPFIKDLRARWVTRPAHEVAKYSYGIYIAHPFAIVLAIKVLHGRPLILQLAVEVVVVAALSIAGYHLIEHPLIKFGSRTAALLERRHERERPLASSTAV